MNLQNFNSWFIKSITTPDDELMGKPTPHQIKNNLCYFYALTLHFFFKTGTLCTAKMKPEIERTILDPLLINNHAFIKIDNLYYDFTHNQGELEYTALLSNPEQYNYIEHKDIADFNLHWNISKKELILIKKTANKIKLSL